MGSCFRLGGQGILLGYLNTFVHAVMYTYYLLTIWKPEIKSSISIKKNITRMQIVSEIQLMREYHHMLYFFFEFIVSRVYVHNSIFKPLFLFSLFLIEFSRFNSSFWLYTLVMYLLFPEAIVDIQSFCLFWAHHKICS